MDDVARLSALEDRLERSEAARGAAHAAQLQDVLQLHAVHTPAGLGLSTASQVALLLRCSENRAGRLLSDALALAELPGAFDVLSSGLLSVEQSSVVVVQLAPLSPPQRLQVWQRLLARLQADREQGAVLPAPRLADLLKRWAIEIDAQAASQRRREAQERARVGYRKRDHDEAHPEGPTCSCNLGPLCRRHHQVKQQGWTEVRGRAGVVFTGPAGRSWLSRPQHPAQASLVGSAVAGEQRQRPRDPCDGLPELELERELWSADPGDPRWDDADGLELRALDVDPDSGEPHDSVRERLTDGDVRWWLDLADPCAWLAPLAELDASSALDRAGA